MESARSLWERACPANTGEAGAMHRVAPFAGQARSHRGCDERANDYALNWPRLARSCAARSSSTLLLAVVCITTSAERSACA